MEFSRNCKLSLIFLTLAAIVACSKDSHKNQGTEDSGGGSAHYSTSEQVGVELERAIKLATDPDQQKNVFAQFWIDSGRKNKHAFIKVPSRLFPNMVDLGATQNLRAPEHADKFKSPFLEALTKNKFIRKAKGDCMVTSLGEHTLPKNL